MIVHKCSKLNELFFVAENRFGFLFLFYIAFKSILGDRAFSRIKHLTFMYGDHFYLSIQLVQCVSFYVL